MCPEGSGNILWEHRTFNSTVSNTNIWNFQLAIRQSKLPILTVFGHGGGAKTPKKEEQRDRAGAMVM